MALLAFAGTALGESTKTTHVTGKKEVTWNFLLKNGPPEPTVKGEWSARAWTYARCAHDSKGEFEAKGGAKFDGMEGFDSGKLQAPQAGVLHATADAWVHMKATAPVPPNAGGGLPVPAGFRRVEATIIKEWEELPAAAPDPQGSSFARAGARGKGSLAVSGQSRFALSGTVNGVNVAIRQGHGQGTGASTKAPGQKGRVHDPVSITLLNERTNEMVTERLFSFDVNGTFNDGGAGWSISANQLVLSGGADPSGNWTSSITMAGDASSSWLLNPLGMFGVSLTGGVFNATGYWANLWTLTSDGMGRTTSASIDLAALNWNMQYVLPESFLNPALRDSALVEDTFTHMITSEFESEADASNVPTPGAISLLGVGALVLASARRRR